MRRIVAAFALALLMAAPMVARAQGPSVNVWWSDYDSPVEQQTPDRLDQRLAALEQQAPNATRAAAWVDRAVWAAAAAAVMYIAKSAGLLH